MSEVGQPQQYRHPGQVFMSRYGLLQNNDQAVFRYVDFLRQEAGLIDEPPVDLSLIYRHFGIPTPLRAPLSDQQGILVDSDAGVILIKEDDPLKRQRFTEGHELIELLFDAQERLIGTGSRPSWNEQKKEQLCDQGAADLLMPQSSFLPRLHEMGISMSTGRTLANLYQTSLLATLVRMIQYGLGAYALVMWHCALRRREMDCLNDPAVLPQKKLRVWWRTRTRSWTSGFIPKNKSISHDSLISCAYTTGQPQNGAEVLNLGWGPIHCQVEAIPMQLGDKYCVLSLLHLLNDSLSPH